ncbi:hypothetical protein BGW38_003313 [Lunasporangiospora selenospora]|uniref:Uncharacterized protein n=1 Tax=Lunasporangiospora selenospora TaxID=979761 RepID=A0A9P6KCX7_9FUNG|nr:hypothetical protein BGW38_003313 [Lunasporangiospora selenospora]
MVMEEYVSDEEGQNSARKTKRKKTGKDEVLASHTQTNEGGSSAMSRAKRDHGRRSSVSGQECIKTNEFCISPDELDMVHYTFRTTNVGQAFKKYQVASLSIVNDIGTMATVSNLSSFLALKLPLDFLPFERGLEYTYCHGVIDTLLTRQFPVRSKYHLDWANKEAQGSKERRANMYKPDWIISSRNNRQELAILEVKPPKEQHCKEHFL